MKFLRPLKEKCSTAFGKALVATSTGASALMLTTVSAHAEDTDISGITTQITTGLTSAKTQFVTSLGAVVVVALGFFIVKFVVRQVIGYFAKIASK